MADNEGGSLLEIITAINNIGNKLDVHIAKMDETNRKTDLVYKTVITGNGTPSLSEEVRKLKERNAAFDKVSWVIGGVVIADVGMRLWQMIINK